MGSRVLVPLLITIIASHFHPCLSVVIECKRHRDECAVNSIIKVTEADRVITDVKNKAKYKVLLFKNAKVTVIPQGIGEKFANLSKLMIQNSSLEVVTKDDFKNLQNLTEIDFSQNLLDKLPSDVFEDLKKLTKIILDSNIISSLPSTIFQFNVELIQISLINNRLQTINDATFKTLKNLKFLYLTGNQLEDFKSGTFTNNEELKVLNVRRNLLKYIPEDIFDNNTNLVFNKNYFIDNTCIKKDQKLDDREDFVEVFREYCKPLNFELVNNLKIELEGIKIELTEKNDEIEELKTKNSENEEKIENQEKDLKNLNEKLKKTEDTLKKDKKDFESKIKDLEKKVDAAKDFQSENTKITSKLEEKIKEIEELTGKFTQTSAEYEMFKKICISKDQELSQTKKEMETLQQENSDIKKECTKETQSLTQSLSKTEKALNEKIESCMKTEEEHKEMKNVIDFQKMTNLLHLKNAREANETIEKLKKGVCENAKVPQARNDVFASPKSTKQISCNFRNLDYSLKGNKISSYYACEIKDFMALDCNAQHNEFTGNHASYKDNRDVTGITMKSSYFTEFPIKILDNSFVSYLNIFQSGFGKIEKICNDKLKYLIVSKSFLSGSSIYINDCENLIHLTIESSYLKKVSLSNLKRLTDLSLKYNEIEEIPQNFFDAMENLKNVQLSKNKITSLDGKIFIKNPKLEIVNFADNPIKSIGAEVFNNNELLMNVNFQNSGCINKQITKAGEVEGLKKDIRDKCKSWNF